MNLKHFGALGLIVFLILSLSLCLNGMSSIKSKISTKAPDFTLKDLNGKSFSLNQYQGKKVVVISFFATWCPPCRMELPLLQSFYEKNQYLGVEVLAIDLREEDSTVEKLIGENGVKFPVLMDRTGAVANAYKVRGIPALFIIDKNGRIAKNHVGYNPNLEKVLKEEILAIQ